MNELFTLVILCYILYKEEKKKNSSCGYLPNMLWFIPNPINIIFELIVYLIIDNITKLIVIRTKKENRFDILIYECIILGFLIGFISLYYYIPYLLIFFLLMHIIGTIYSEKSFGKIKEIVKQLYESVFRSSSSKISETTKIPKEYLYNYHLKPTNDLRLQQSSLIPRPGIFNVHGTTCSLNALLQSLASLNGFYLSLQRNINFSRFNYEAIVSEFVDLISQLRNDHRTSEYKHCTTLVDTSGFISKLNLIYPDLLTKNTTTDICELFQCIIDLLSDSLAKQSTVYSTNVTEQVQNPKLTTYSLDYLNKLFAETEAQLHDKVTLDNLDTQTSYIIQYVDLTWLLHHIQLGSIMKHTFSGQILHAHCCNNCSHVRFRAEPFQILTLPINQTKSTLEKIISQLTKIEIIDSMSCSCCSNQIDNDQERLIKHGALRNKITNTLSPIVTTRRPYSDQIYSSTPISSSINNIIPSTTNHIPYRIKTQTMIANFPDVLCIQLKRFSYDRLSNTTRKLNTSILIEPEKILDLSFLHYTTWLGLPNLSISSHYRLIAICLHLSENPIMGHCVCLYRTDHSRWFLSDDERITEINQIDHLFQTSYITDNCYLLFYERCL